MPINKNHLYELILQQLKCVLSTAKQAALQAYETATNGETVAENKYDTFGLEASYLAVGQSKRVTQYEEDLALFQSLKLNKSNANNAISITSLVVLEDKQHTKYHYFISPVAGGLKVTCENEKVVLITPNSPLGNAIIGLYIGDEFVLTIKDTQIQYHILFAS